MNISQVTIVCWYVHIFSSLIVPMKFLLLKERCVSWVLLNVNMWGLWWYTCIRGWKLCLFLFGISSSVEKFAPKIKSIFTTLQSFLWSLFLVFLELMGTQKSLCSFLGLQPHGNESKSLWKALTYRFLWESPLLYLALVQHNTKGREWGLGLGLLFSWESF